MPPRYAGYGLAELDAPSVPVEDPPAEEVVPVLALPVVLLVSPLDPVGPLPEPDPVGLQSWEDRIGLCEPNG